MASPTRAASGRILGRLRSRDSCGARRAAPNIGTVATISSAPLRRDLRASCVDGCMFNVMVGMGELYFPAFALAMGLDKVTSGLVVTVPLLVGSGLQLISPWAVARLGSNGRWVVWTCAVQAASFLPLVLGAALGGLPVPALFASVALYFGAGFASGPAWTTWIETLVPPRIAERYFAQRAVWCYVCLLAAVLLAGFLLEASESLRWGLLGFAALFAVAGIARAVSVRCLRAQREPVPRPQGERHVPMSEILAGGGQRPARRFLTFLLVTYLALNVSVPFVTSYFRAELRLPYGQFALLLALPSVARIAVLAWLGRAARRIGARRLMWIGSIALVPAAALLPVSREFAWIAIVQVVTGLAMGAFDLANLLLWFETIRPQERTSILTTYQFWYAAAVVLGSSCGSMLLAFLGEGRTAFVALFLASAALRVVASALFARTRAGRVVPAS